MSVNDIIAASLGGVTYDPDAQAFFTAAGITNSTQKSAVNQLVLDLKGYSIWSSMVAIYPMVGGTSTTCKYNLVNPADTDGAFRLTFSGTWTFASTGALPNGSDAYANTHLIPSTSMTDTSGHLAYYSRTNTAAGAYREMGMNAGGVQNELLIRFSGDAMYPIYSAGLSGSVSNSDSRGLFMTNETTVNFGPSGWKNGSRVVDMQVSTPLAGGSVVYIGASNQAGTPYNYSNRECAYASLGAGLSDANCANLYTAVQAFQTTLGRQV